MVNIECERLVPYGVKGALFETSFYALIFNLNNHIWI